MAGEVSLTMEQITVAVREGVAQAASSTSVTDIVSAGSALALVLLTGVLARYTWILAQEAQKARESQTQPNVIVTAVHDENRPTIIQLVIRNIGHGLAENVTFKTSRPLFCRLWTWRRDECRGETYSARAIHHGNSSTWAWREPNH